jgi:hypothetical protein
MWNLLGPDETSASTGLEGRSTRRQPVILRLRVNPRTAEGSLKGEISRVESTVSVQQPV